MLKLPIVLEEHDLAVQPPLGGCVLKLAPLHHRHKWVVQPPLGGCVLKPRAVKLHAAAPKPSRL